ncbi:60S ribosomal protein L23a-like [Microtus oregoni]|uniref:60S ribosomal protein L23a-like n=1 Tax=Microtus oregoni TaxID=111838 RepID=UPI001BB1DC2D|nr:60S ribosomal protein L23a-like [Microtus oregoni]
MKCFLRKSFRGQPFHQDCAEREEGTACLSKAKAKTLKTKKVMLKGARSLKRRRSEHHPPLAAHLLRVQTQPKYPQKSTPRISLTATPSSNFTRPLSLKKTEDNTLALAVNVKAGKPQIKWAMKKLYDSDVAKVNTLIRPDREKKVYVPLAPDYDAPDVASKIGTI